MRYTLRRQSGRGCHLGVVLTSIDTGFLAICFRLLHQLEISWHHFSLRGTTTSITMTPFLFLFSLFYVAPTVFAFEYLVGVGKDENTGKNGIGQSSGRSVSQYQLVMKRQVSTLAPSGLLLEIPLLSNSTLAPTGKSCVLASSSSTTHRLATCIQCDPYVN